MVSGIGEASFQCIAPCFIDDSAPPSVKGKVIASCSPSLSLSCRPHSDVDAGAFACACACLHTFLLACTTQVLAAFFMAVPIGQAIGYVYGGYMCTSLDPSQLGFAGWRAAFALEGALACLVPAVRARRCRTSLLCFCVCARSQAVRFARLCCALARITSARASADP